MVHHLQQHFVVHFRIDLLFLLLKMNILFSSVFVIAGAENENFHGPSFGPNQSLVIDVDVNENIEFGDAYGYGGVGWT